MSYSSLERLLKYRAAVEAARPHRETYALLVEYANGLHPAELTILRGYKDSRVDWTDAPRPAVVGGECGRCLHRPPFHKPGCVLLPCLAPLACACAGCYRS